MKKLKRTFLGASILSAVLFTTCREKDDIFNLGFERLNANGYPIGWHLNGSIKIDSLFFTEGKYSLQLYKKLGASGFVSCSNTINAPITGRLLKLKGDIRSENIKNGFAGLWIRIEDKNGDILSFENMQGNGIVDSHDWNKYSIEVPFDAKASKVYFGVLLAGSGSAWVDNLQLFIDDTPIQNVALKRTDFLPADEGSGINTIHLSKQQIRFLTDLAMVWGFLKYHYPTVIEGRYDWDNELFKAIRKTASETSAIDFNKAIETWIDSLPPIKDCESKTDVSKLDIKILPTYGYIFNHHFPTSLENKFAAILDVCKGCYTDQYYVGIAPQIGNPFFKNENGFINIYNPDAGIRLLSLFRYWNMIQYFCPNRQLLGNWNAVLSEFIPKFIAASNRQEYILTCLELTTRINDGHAFTSDRVGTLDSIKGLQITPFQAKFIENKLVVTGFYDDSEKGKDNFKLGDIIEAIDSISIDSLVRKYIKYTSGSNQESQLASLASVTGFLLRSNKKSIKVKVKDEKGLREVLTETIPLASANTIIDYRNIHVSKGFERINNNIGYIYPALLKDKDIDSIRILFNDAKGIIFDFRCYPSTFMPFIYGSWLKPNRSDFAKFTLPSILLPGAILNGNVASNGGQQATYSGKVVLIVNSSTFSQAEYTVMALSTIPKAVVLGSISAGADGDVSAVLLPGGLRTAISGLGVYYPDGTEAQKAGVKIDMLCSSTIKGIKEGRDELMEKAIYLIEHAP